VALSSGRSTRFFGVMSLIAVGALLHASGITAFAQDTLQSTTVSVASNDANWSDGGLFHVTLVYSGSDANFLKEVVDASMYFSLQDTTSNPTTRDYFAVWTAASIQKNFTTKTLSLTLKATCPANPGVSHLSTAHKTIAPDGTGKRIIILTRHQTNAAASPPTITKLTYKICDGENDLSPPIAELATKTTIRAGKTAGLKIQIEEDDIE
jgi:hypothetical protein